jgi:hypothetical protein
MNGHIARALAVARESESLFEPLAQRWPAVFGPQLAAVRELLTSLQCPD